MLMFWVGVVVGGCCDVGGCWLGGVVDGDMISCVDMLLVCWVVICIGQRDVCMVFSSRGALVGITSVRRPTCPFHTGFGSRG